MKFRRSPVAIALLATAELVAMPGAVFAQASSAPQPAAPTQLERVEVTGSSIKRIAAETALPVQVLTSEEIARTGVTTTEQLLRTYVDVHDRFVFGRVVYTFF